MKRIYLFVFAFIAFGQSSGFGQNIKSEEVSYSYYRLPLEPLAKNITHYQASIEAPFEAKNKQLIKEYEDQKKESDKEYARELADYEKELKEATDDYNKDKEEYNKKSNGKKWVEKNILEENNKPVKQLPSKPSPPSISKPYMQRSYDYKVLTDTYIKLDGFENNPANALKILVTMYGYDYSQPRVMSEQSSGTSPSTYYHAEFSYRHPMAVKVTMPDGKEILNVTPPSLNIYKNYKTPATAGMQQVNQEALIQSSEEKVLQDNLFFINDLLNNRYTFSTVKRTGKLYYIKNKQELYGDITTAFNGASGALQLMQTDSATAKANLRKAIEVWNTALKESDITNKKARIDKDVTIAIYFNLLEANFALGDVTAGKAILDKFNAINLSGDDRKAKNDFEVLYSDLKVRQQNNK